MLSCGTLVHHSSYVHLFSLNWIWDGLFVFIVFCYSSRHTEN
jgi:hypothetical protein